MFVYSQPIRLRSGLTLSEVEELIMDVQSILKNNSSQFGQKPAVIFRGQNITFHDLYEKVLKLANALKHLGVKSGDKVAVYLPNSPEYVFSYLACLCLGAVVVPLDYMLKEDELISCMNHAEVKLLIAQSRQDVSLENIKTQVHFLEKIVMLGEKTLQEIPAYSFNEIMDQAKAAELKVRINPSDPALIMYTSGTTGKPKGILLNYRHLDGSPEAMKYFVDLTGKDVKLCAIPLSHSGGFVYVQNCIVFGITLVLMDRFHPLEFLKNVEQYKVTCFHIVPAMYTALLSLKNIGQYNLSSLRFVVVFGSPSSPEVLEQFHRYCPNAQLLNGWGMTETCPPNTVTPLRRGPARDAIANLSSVGKPAPHCEIKIVDED